MNDITRDYAALVEDVSTQERMVTARINTASVDRFRTVIDPNGIDLGAYKRNPVVLWEHGKDPQRGSLPVGQNRWIKAIGSPHSEIRARTQFGKDDYSQGLFEMYRDGLLRGWSVRVLPDEKRCSKPTRDEMRARPDLEGCDMMYRAGELAEYSAVAVPGNAETLTMLESRGIWYPDDETRATAPPPPMKAHADDDDESSEEGEDEGEEDAEFRYIRKHGDKWTVYSEAGKPLGTHDSRESAVKQLQAIEAHKHDAGRSLIMLRRDMASDFQYMETRLMTRMRDLSDLLRGKV